MTARSHDTLAYRPAEILLKLNQDEQITVSGLADGFGVTEPTVYRDLNRLAGIVEHVGGGQYRLVPEYRGKLSARDLGSFATIAGVGDLFPNSHPRFLANLLDTFAHSSFLVRRHRYEQVEPHDARFNALNKAVQNHNWCSLTYADKRRTLKPYRLINTRGIWYLAATENGTLKAFRLTGTSETVVHARTFEPNAAIRARIENENGVWFSEKISITLTVASEAAYYFKRRNLLPSQTVISETPNGARLIRSEVRSEEQILPLIRYWIPHVHIVEPENLSEMLKKQPERTHFKTPSPQHIN